MRVYLDVTHTFANDLVITLEYDDAKTADAIANSVSPDNLMTPTGLFIKTVSKGSRVLTKVKTGAKLATFIATIDDLLFCVSIAEETLRTVAKK